MAAGIMKQRERRVAPRVTERVSLSIHDAGAQITTESKNLSASGVYCALDRFIAPMTKLALQFDLPGGARRTTVRCTGVVVRVEPTIANAERGQFNVAIFFTELAPRHRDAITRFVRQRLSAGEGS